MAVSDIRALCDAKDEGCASPDAEAVSEGGSEADGELLAVTCSDCVADAQGDPRFDAEGWDEGDGELLAVSCSDCVADVMPDSERMV